MAFPTFHSQMADSPKPYMKYLPAQAVTQHGKIKDCCLTAHLCYCRKKFPGAENVFNPFFSLFVKDERFLLFLH